MDPGLAAVAAWLRKRGKAVRPFLNKEQRQHLRECFELIDTDGSGDIDVGELHAVFEALGDHVSIRETVEMMREVDRDGSMSIEFPEFVEIMTQVRTDKDEEQPKLKDGCPKTQHIQLMASAYRRKKVMEGVIMDQGSWRTKFVRLHEARLEEARQAEQARKARLLKRQDTLAFALEAMASTGRRGSGTGSRTSSSASVLKLTPRLDDIPTADASTVGDLTARSTRSDQLKQESNAGSPRSTWSMLGSPRERHPPTPIGRQSDCSGAQTARTVTLVSPRPSPRPAADPAANGKGSLWGKLALQKAAPDEKLVGSGLNGGAESLKALKLRAAIRRKYESDAQEVAVSRIWLACRSASFSKKPKKCNPGSSGDAHRQTASGSTDCETPNGAAGSINIATTSQAGPCADELQVGSGSRVPRLMLHLGQQQQQQQQQHSTPRCQAMPSTLQSAAQPQRQGLRSPRPGQGASARSSLSEQPSESQIPSTTAQHAEHAYGEGESLCDVNTTMRTHSQSWAVQGALLMLPATSTGPTFTGGWQEHPQSQRSTANGATSLVHTASHSSVDADAMHQLQLHLNSQQQLGIVPALKHVKAVSNVTAVVTPSYAVGSQAHLMWGDDDSSLAHTLAVNGNTARTSVFHMLAGEAPQPGSARQHKTAKRPLTATAARPSTATAPLASTRRPASLTTRQPASLTTRRPASLTTRRPPSLTVHFGATHRPRSPNGPLSPSRTLGPQLRDALSPTVEKRRLALSLPLKPHVAKVDQGGPSGSKSARYMRDAGPLGSATGHCAKHQARATVHEVPLLALPTSTVEELLTGGSKAVRAARRQALTERATAKPTAMRQRIKLEAQEQVRCSAA